jgi:hypothetical protein
MVRTWWGAGFIEVAAAFSSPKLSSGNMSLACSLHFALSGEPAPVLGWPKDQVGHVQAAIMKFDFDPQKEPRVVRMVGVLQP